MAVVLDLDGADERYLICGKVIRESWPLDRWPVAVAVCAELVPCPKHPDPVTAPRLAPDPGRPGIASADPPTPQED